MTDCAYLALAMVPGIGRARLEVLLATFGSAEAVLDASPEDLAAVEGVTPALVTAVTRSMLREAEDVLHRVAALGAATLLPADPAFPQALREIPDAPTYLFALGNSSLLHDHAVGIVGSRTHSRYGAGVTRMFAGGLARAGLVIVSGMARGLDAIAHGAALDAGGGTVGVLGNGFGVIYPVSNRTLYERVVAEGCLLTEHPPGARPHRGSFPRRNRLISGLARVTLVTEARRQSGTLITVGKALSQGRDVLAVPGPITSPLSAGCNHLIQCGAKPALGLRDVLEEYGMATGNAPGAMLPSNLSEAERRVLDVLGLGTDHVDDVARHLGGSVADTLGVLTSLEIRGLVTQEPGKIFRLCTT